MNQEDLAQLQREAADDMDRVVELVSELYAIRSRMDHRSRILCTPEAAASAD
jgi:hypothetical protein